MRLGLHASPSRMTSWSIRPMHTSSIRQQSKEPPSDHQSSQKPSLDRDSNNFPPPHETPPPITPPNYQNYSRFFRQLAQSMPHLTRPTRDDFLNATSNFWERLRIRFKWLTIRSFRKFNADDLSAFFSFALVGHTIWILIGTTTFFSVVIWTINSLRLQNYFARAISDYMTHETGVTVVFESAIVPKWRDSRISFKNVYISRRPRDSSALSVTSASSRTGTSRYDAGHGPAFYHDEDDLPPPLDTTEDLNYSMFDLNVDSIDVTLSLTQWLDGKGLVKDAEIRGVRGILDRRNVYFDPDKPLDPADFRRVAQGGEFHLESLQLEDVLITIYQPNDFRPYTASIFRADLHCLRKQWLCYDFLRAENMVGQIDNCLFSLHRPQSIGRTVEADMKDTPWEVMSRFRIDGLNIDHLQAATQGPGSPSGGPISWITAGKFDTVLDIRFPRSISEDFDINALINSIAANLTNLNSDGGDGDRIPGQRVLAKPALTAPGDPEDEQGGREEDGQKVWVDVDLRFRDIKAAVPLFPDELSRVNSALIRPIVAFMNANRTLIPIHCRVKQDLSDFDGSWTPWETGLLDSVSLKVYEALAYHVTRANMTQRIRTVSRWTLQQTAKAVVGAARAAMDPVALQVQLA